MMHLLIYLRILRDLTVLTVHMVVTARNIVMPLTLLLPCKRRHVVPCIKWLQICGIFTHSFVHAQFGHGISIPLLKGAYGIVNDKDNNRDITLLPVISKVLKRVNLGLCENVLETDNRQIGQM